MDDAELLRRFEECTLERAAWTHRAHVRVGYLYTTRHSFDEALARMRRGIRALNESHGVKNDAEGGYHETITRAFLRLVRHAAVGGGHADSEAFCDAHTELTNKRLLLEYYSEAVLRGEAARVGFVPPDIGALPAD